MLKGKKGTFREEDCSNIGSVSLEYDNSWVQGVEVEPVLKGIIV